MRIVKTLIVAALCLGGLTACGDSIGGDSITAIGPDGLPTHPG